MSNDFAHTLKGQAETALTDPCFDFIAKYHAVTDLRQLARKQPGVLDDITISALEQLLQSTAFRKVRQAYVLFREAASVMTDMATAPGNNGMGPKALASLNRLLLMTDGHAHRGVAEALGNLPVSIKRPLPIDNRRPSPPSISWTRLLGASGLAINGTPWFIGRSLVAKTSEKHHLFVVKLAKKGDTAAGLAKEISWMERLEQSEFGIDCRFHIPLPLLFGNQRVFRINRIPVSLPVAVNRHSDGLAIAFIAHRDYFVYPNQLGSDGDAAREVLKRSALLLGRLAASGVIHDAPIPLFHNRTQRLRREDQGRYQWFRSGRLDQWLDSCAFPNFGLSGLRDFEHLEPFDGDSRILYRHIGSHFLSLLLVAGSHFRCRDKAKAGWDRNGKPVDARHLFDRQFRAVPGRYEPGDPGSQRFHARRRGPSENQLVVSNSGRMIEEMGVDSYMTELLRQADQKALTDGEFFGFLMERGYSAEQLKGLKRGEKDILISSGPHLGDFNRQISLPELITGVAAMSAVCIAGRFANETASSTLTGHPPKA